MAPILGLRLNVEIKKLKYKVELLKQKSWKRKSSLL